MQGPPLQILTLTRQIPAQLLQKPGRSMRMEALRHDGVSLDDAEAGMHDALCALTALTASAGFAQQCCHPGLSAASGAGSQPRRMRAAVKPGGAQEESYLPQL